MAKCEECGKTTQFGRTIQYNHGGKWFRRAPKKNPPFKPNVYRHSALKNVVMVRMKICTRSLRTLAKRAAS